MNTALWLSLLLSSVFAKHFNEAQSSCNFQLWQQWSKCSTTCDKGSQIRMRAYRVTTDDQALKHKCGLFSIELKDCFLQKCPTGCEVGEWFPWSECSQTCDNGVMHRRRELLSSSMNASSICPALEEIKTCKLQSCGNEEMSIRYCHFRKDGNYLYPEQLCSQAYYSCAGSVHREQKCQDELVFNPDTNRCEFPKNVAHCSQTSAALATWSTIYFVIFNCFLVLFHLRISGG